MGRPPLLLQVSGEEDRKDRRLIHNYSGVITLADGESQEGGHVPRGHRMRGSVRCIERRFHVRTSPHALPR
jgi:hypothetical protein